MRKVRSTGAIKVKMKHQGVRSVKPSVNPIYRPKKVVEKPEEVINSDLIILGKQSGNNLENYSLDLMKLD